MSLHYCDFKVSGADALYCWPERETQRMCSGRWHAKINSDRVKRELRSLHTVVNQFQCTMHMLPASSNLILSYDFETIVRHDFIFVIVSQRT